MVSEKTIVSSCLEHIGTEISVGPLPVIGNDFQVSGKEKTSQGQG